MLPKVHEVRLDNGFRALLVERRNLPVVATVLWYRVGSRDERTGETGLSHFLEHMMFKGTDRYAKGEIDLLTSKLGGSNNAFTDNDSTAYYFALASDRWETALEIEASRMRSCLLDTDEFEAEKNVVLEELAMGQDDPARVLFEATESLAFQVHPYHHPVIGWRQDVAAVSRDGMRAYYDRHYGPNRSFLVAVGDLDAKKAGKRIQELFGGMPRVDERAPVLDEPAPRGERRSVIRAQGNVPRLAMACRICRMGERDDFVLDLLSNVLSSGKASRLYRRLVLDDELATDVTVYNEPRFDPGLFWVIAELRPGADPQVAEERIRDELDTLRRDGVTAAELRRARVQVRSSFLFEGETVLDTALKIARFEGGAADGYKLLGHVLSTYDDIDRAELRRVAERYFTTPWTVVWSVPEDAVASATRRLPARKKTKARKKKPVRAAAKKAAKRKVVKKAAATRGTTKRAVTKKKKAPVRKTKSSTGSNGTPTTGSSKSGGKRSS